MKNKEAKENAKPKILPKSKEYAQKFMVEGKIEERLMGFKKKIEGKKQVLEERYKD